MKYEVYGKTLAEAVNKSLTNCSLKADAGEQNTCRQLTRWIDQLSSDAGDLANQIDRLSNRLDNLRQSRRDNIPNATIGTVTAAAGALSSAARTARTVQQILRGGSVGLGNVLSIVPFVGGAILTARSIIAAYQDLQEIREAVRDLDRLEHVADALEGTAREIRQEWYTNQCERYFI